MMWLQLGKMARVDVQHGVWREHWQLDIFEIAQGDVVKSYFNNKYYFF